jgi:hypothetical protein
MANPFSGATQSFTVQPASPPSMSGSTATQQAYGTAPSTGPRTAAYGAVIAGVAGVVVLAFLYHSLPR